MINWYIGRFVFYLGIFLVVAGSLELFFTSRAYRFWKRWIEHRFFPVHGFLLIAAGMPLTVYEGSFSTFIFVFGVTVVLTGPFVLIYPEKIRNSFRDVESQEGELFQHRIVRFDGMLRIACGAVFMISQVI